MNKLKIWIVGLALLGGCMTYAHWTDQQAANDAGKETTIFTVK